MNIIAKCVPGKEYIIKSMMATPLTASQFEKVKELNQERFADYRFIPFKDTDFSWWDKITQKLTKTKIKDACFNCDFNGKVSEY